MSKLLLRLAGDATVRATITADAQHVFSVYDFMDLACPTQCDSWTKMTWKRLIAEDSEFKAEIKSHDPRGIAGAPGDLGWQGGRRFPPDRRGHLHPLHGRGHLDIEEIRSKAASSAPIHQAYRQALAQEPVVDEAGTKRQLEREDALFELEIQERNLAIHERKLALEERKPADRGLDEDSNAQSASAAEKHSMKCVRVQSLVSTSYSSHPDRSYSSHPSECLRDKQRRRNVFLKALSKEKHSMKCVCEH